MKAEGYQMLRMENLSSKIFPSFTEGPLSPLSPSMPPLCPVIAQIQLPHVCLHISPIYLGSLAYVNKLSIKRRLVTASMIRFLRFSSR